MNEDIGKAEGRGVCTNTWSPPWETKEKFTFSVLKSCSTYLIGNQATKTYDTKYDSVDTELSKWFY